jgi:hypothetical protein
MPKKRKPFFIRGKRRMRGAGTKVGPDHPYIKPDKTFDPQELLEQLSDAPGAFSLLIINDLIDKKEIPAYYHQTVEEIVDRLVDIVAEAASGDERCGIQFRAIQKIVRPEKYELPYTKIQEIAEKYETRPQLARGWELRRLMAGLSHAVEPVNPEQNLPEHPIRLRGKPKDANDLWYWTRAAKHWKPKSTLQSLAIRIYLAQLQEAGVTDHLTEITERSLKRDLAEVRKFEQVADEERERRRGHWYGRSFEGSPQIEWYEFSEGWKEQRKKRTKKEQRVSKKRH